MRIDVFKTRVAIDKWLQIISNSYMLFKTVIPLRI